MKLITLIYTRYQVDFITILWISKLSEIRISIIALTTLESLSHKRGEKKKGIKEKETKTQILIKKSIENCFILVSLWIHSLIHNFWKLLPFLLNSLSLKLDYDQSKGIKHWNLTLRQIRVWFQSFNFEVKMNWQ